jgi:hypothetical protein
VCEENSSSSSSDSSSSSGGSPKLRVVASDVRHGHSSSENSCPWYLVLNVAYILLAGCVIMCFRTAAASAAVVTNQPSPTSQNPHVLST